ncbi:MULTISPECIES: his operon leader peptide [Kluyvera]|uniref:his operon leader peptide n=1 Tax=Kluyvera intermedia TaxID=61648 RepID=A0A5Q2U0Z5_KLUIN|nr:his operon leader peptide [Kluyvera intermedia]MRS15096.1 his operon leader peptide [Enterobacteriaceae bacterium RIT691]QGH32192.1 his operon leader peptide [Kluyvera intermedia]QGH41174.1 his operon leader peptide [Kluyvera intermedia]WEJ86526.1 MAG: his operon leader peptide [Kluyvera intermedia]WGL58303.1 his operon leader peptide [Kluyvera intermedia]
MSRVQIKLHHHHHHPD